MLLLLLLGCTPEDPPVCEAFADTPSAPDGTLHNGDSCGWWELVVGEQIVASIELVEADHTCEATVGDGLTTPYAPIYSNLSNDVPKVTVQIVAESVAAGSDLAIACTEGTEWAALVDVVAE